MIFIYINLQLALFIVFGRENQQHKTVRLIYEKINLKIYAPPSWYLTRGQATDILKSSKEISFILAEENLNEMAEINTSDSRALYRYSIYIEYRYNRFDWYIGSNVSVSNKISIIWK